MILPIGLGSKLKIFPFGIILISAICIAWSYHFFWKVAEVRVITLDRHKDNLVVVDKKKQTVMDKRRLNFLYQVCLAEKRSGCGIIQRMMETDRKSKPKTERKVANTKGKKNVIGILEKTKDFIIFSQEMSGEPENFPEYAKQHPEYEKFLASHQRQIQDNIDLHKDYGFLTSQAVNVMSLLRATFTHGDWAHLMGNLLLIILIGVWVEQRAGVTLTVGSFVIGSFVGFGYQLYMVPNSPVLGASAGLFTLMGMFFCFFYHKQMEFIMGIFPFYFRRVTLPALLTFPIFFFVGEFIAIKAAEGTGIANHAHVGGLVIGLFFGFLIRKVENLGPDAVYPQELQLLNRLEKSTSEVVTWNAFRELMQWNHQNWKGVNVFLGHLRRTPGILNSSDRQEYFIEIMQIYFQKILKNPDLKHVEEVILSLPRDLDITSALSQNSDNQVLVIADYFANQADYELARSIYLIVLARHRRGSRLHVERAVQEIDKLINRQIIESQNNAVVS